MYLSLELGDSAIAGYTVDEAHFGLNFVADYERIGVKPWEKFDDLVARLSIEHLRYPGGTSAETVFDYRQPDADQFTTTTGETLKLTPLSQYIQYCNLQGINPTIIIPTRNLLSSTTDNGQRLFDQDQAKDLVAFIEGIISKIDPALQVSFELGNEYESYMTSTEYGRVANALVGLIDEAYEGVKEIQQDSSPSEPKIFVQAWAYSVASGLTQADLSDRNQQVISQIAPENLSKIDGVVSHYYYDNGRNSGTDQAQSFEEIAKQVAWIADLQRSWEVVTDKDLELRMSEWNVLFRSVTETGLKQMRPLLEMFTSFVRSGFDALDFWSAQYHSTSIADASGRFMAAGALLNVLKPNIVGMKVGDTHYSTEASTYHFVSEASQVAVVASATSDSLAINLIRADYPDGFILTDGFLVSVDPKSVDGLYRGMSNLPVYMEPDANFVAKQIAVESLSANESSIQVGAFEVLVLVFTEATPGYSITYGSDYADLFYGTDVPTLYVGGASFDTVSYIGNSASVVINLGMSVGNDAYQGDLYVSIESVRGTNFGDLITGSDRPDLLSGAGGDDTVFGGDGADSVLGLSGDDELHGGMGIDEISGHNGSDTIFGGLGDDRIFGGSEDDLILPGGGADIIYGDGGIDTLSFSDCDSGVTIWANDGFVESSSGLVKFTSIESYIGTALMDRFDAPSLSSSFQGLGGDDVFQARMGGFHEVQGGAGNDTFFFCDGSGMVFGGDGDDMVYNYSGNVSFDGGDGDDRVISYIGGGVFTGGAGDDVYFAYGRGDVFHFSLGSGVDIIRGFESGVDRVELHLSEEDLLSVSVVGAGSELVLADGSSILFANCFNFVADDFIFV